MKKLAIGIIIGILLVSTLCVFSGCSLIAKAQGKTYVSYVQSGAYTVGELETDQMAEDFLINWYGGSVNITQYDGDKIIFKETANQDLSDDMKLHWAFWDSSEYGKYYQIQYCSKGIKDLRTIRKDLTVLLPKNIVEYNKFSITGRQGCDINIYLPDVSVVGENQGHPNVHLDTDKGNINAVFKDIDNVRMIGADDGKEANKYYSRLSAQKIGSINYVTSYARAIFEIESITDYADIKQFSGDIYMLCNDNIRKLTLSNTTGTTFIATRTFNKLDFTAREGLIGVEIYDFHQKFVVTMSNYTEYSNNVAYKEPHFMGKVGYVPDDELQPGDPDDLYDVTHTGDVWRVRDGKDKYGRDVEVKVESGADVYFGSPQSLYETLKDTGIFYDLPSDPVINTDDNQNANPNEDPNANQNENQNQDPNGNPNQDPNWNPNQNQQ